LNLNRYRITFTRDRTVRFVGHLDLVKTWERILRRADLPVTYSQGFHPLPKITFASALPVGCTSQAELMDVVLDRPVESAELLQRLASALPAGMAVTSMGEVPLNSPALQAELRWAEYAVEVEVEAEAEAEVGNRVQTFMAAASVMRERRGKSYDLRPLVLMLSVEAVESDRVKLAMRLMADANAGTGRPDEVLAALGWAAAPAHIHRCALGFTVAV
jgi:radical SAM-linked protein